MSILSALRRAAAPTPPDVAPREHRREGIDAICGLTPRTTVRVDGVVSAVVVQPVGAPARFEIEIDDGTGRLTARWMGRNHIAGIDTGTRIEVEGVASGPPANLVIYNPKYAIHGAKDSEL